MQLEPHTMKLRRRQFLRLAGAASVLPFAPHVVRAQAWPARTIRVIAPFSAGSTIDVVARLLLEPLSQQLGQTLVLENRVGAGGMTGATVVARADPDGHTFLVNSSAHSAIPAIFPNVPYDTARDFAAVASLGSSPNVTVVAPEKGIKTLQQLVAAAKAKPGGLTFATAGVGSATHLSTERFRASAGFEATHVPFKGMPEALTEVLTGRVDFSCSSIAPAMPLIRDGKLIALAVTTPKRSSALPDVPTSLEAGYANSDYTFWMGMFAPAKTPREIIDRMNQEVEKTLSASVIQQRLAQHGIDPMPIAPAAFDALVRNEVDGNIALVKSAGIKLQ
jgi:tripartite-type tricarboxylate transporter receptor subunit TctC